MWSRPCLHLRPAVCKYRRVVERQAVSPVSPAVVDEIFTPDYVVVNIPPWRTPGAEGLKQFITDNYRMFPDVHQIIEDMVAEDDRVAVYLKATATHKGDLDGPVGLVPATNKKVSWEGVIFLRFKDGKIVETKGVYRQYELDAATRRYSKALA